MRNAAARAALFKEDQAVCLRIEEAPVIRNESRAGAAMQKHDWLTVWSATLLVIELVNRRDTDMAAIVGLGLVVKSSECFHIDADYRGSTWQFANLKDAERSGGDPALPLILA